MPCLALPSRALLQTMRDLLTHGAAAFGLSGFVVVDCRYEYEHKGGHLPGAQRRSMSLAMWPRTAICLLACTSLSHQHGAPASLPSFMLLPSCFCCVAQARCTSRRQTSCSSSWRPIQRSTGRWVARLAHLGQPAEAAACTIQPACHCAQLDSPAHAARCLLVRTFNAITRSLLAIVLRILLCPPAPCFVSSSPSSSPSPSSSTASSPASAGPELPSLCATRWA